MQPFQNQHDVFLSLLELTNRGCRVARSPSKITVKTTLPCTTLRPTRNKPASAIVGSIPPAGDESRVCSTKHSRRTRWLLYHVFRSETISEQSKCPGVQRREIRFRTRCCPVRTHSPPLLSSLIRRMVASNRKSDCHTVSAVAAALLFSVDYTTSVAANPDFGTPQKSPATE